VRGFAVVVLTDRRLLIRKTAGKPIEIPAADGDIRAGLAGRREQGQRDIAGAHAAKWFRRRRIGGRRFLVVETAAGPRHGMLVHDPAAWVSALDRSQPSTGTAGFDN
jgi:hypothetical protein